MWWWRLTGRILALVSTGSWREFLAWFPADGPAPATPSARASVAPPHGAGDGHRARPLPGDRQRDPNILGSLELSGYPPSFI